MNVTQVGEIHNCDCGFSWRTGKSGSHECGYGLRKQLAALKAERDSLAVEVAARGEIIERLIGQYSAAGYHAVQNSLNPAQSLLYDAIQVLKQPATDAYFNLVRAEGVELVKSHPAITLCNLTHVCKEIANQLRSCKDGE